MFRSRPVSESTHGHCLFIHFFVLFTYLLFPWIQYIHRKDNRPALPPKAWPYTPFALSSVDSVQKFFELAIHSGNIAIAHNAPMYAPMLTCLGCTGNQIDFGHTMEEESISYQSSPLGSELVMFLKSNFYPVFIWPELPSQDANSDSKPAQLVTSFLFEFNQTMFQGMKGLWPFKQRFVLGDAYIHI